MFCYLKGISQDHPHYKKCYEIFEKKCGKDRLFREWADNEFPSIIKAKFDPKSVDSVVRSLGIGSGSGKFEFALLKQVQLHCSTILHTVVEPSSEYVSQYKNSSTLDDIEYDWQIRTFQEYMEVRRKDRKFDFISSVNSLYYVDDLDETLRFLVDGLARNGLLMVALRSDKGIGLKLINTFPELHVVFDGQFLLSSRDVIAKLEAMQMKVTVHHLTTTVDVSSVFSDEYDEEGDALLDFYTGVVNFRTTAPKGLVTDILDFLRANEYPANSGSKLCMMQFDILIVNH